MLTFGGVLDESMLLFRRHWIYFALVSAVSLFPPGVVLVWLSAAGFMSRQINLNDLRNGGAILSGAALNTQIAQLAAALAYLFVYFFFGLLWSAATVVTTDAYLRGEEPRLTRIYGRALRRYIALVLSSVVLGMMLVALLLLASALFVVTGFGIIGGLVAVIGLALWWLRPGARKSWLKVLIIVVAPFGLPIYFGTRWALYLAAIVLEDRGPLRAFARSGELTERVWFRVAAILWVASMIVGVMLSVLGTIITLPFTIADALHGQFGLSPNEAAISSGATFVIRMLVASVGSIVYTLLFVDLRNRREGADILERLGQLEASPVVGNG